MSAYTYIRSEPALWTVGHFTPEDEWEPESDHGSSDEAAARVRWLNGGPVEQAAPTLADVLAAEFTDTQLHAFIVEAERADNQGASHWQKLRTAALKAVDCAECRETR